MECPSCTFENSPGLRACLRCGGLLDFSGVAVEPPRASGGRTRRRVRAAAQRTGSGVRRAGAELNRSLRLPLGGGARWSDLGWSILPGLAQIRRGPRVLGWALLSAWGGVLLLAAAFIGSGFSTLLCLGAISLHCLAVSLVLNTTLSSVGLFRRAAFGLALYGVLLLALYRPVQSVGRSVFRALEAANLRPGSAIANGDVVLYTGSFTRPHRFERGDLVVYEIDARGGGGVVVRAGLGIERVLGVPGDHIELSDGTLWLNGEELSRQLWPIGGIRGLPAMALSAGESEYIVIPSVLQYRTQGQAAAALKSMIHSLSRVRDDHIRGRVFWRARPWTRAGVPAGPPEGES